jgi:hypothetical protein
MTLRNFWITAKIDGQKTKIAGGPRAKDGGFELTILMRDDGEKIHGLTVEGYASEDGRLRLVARESADADPVVDFETKR